MKNIQHKIVIGSFVCLSLWSCNKQETSENSIPETTEYATTDSVSLAARQEVAGKKFVKTAEVDMEVMDVYDATIYIEKSLLELGGFVSQSHLQSNIVSEDTYETSDKDAVLVKKFLTENRMQVRVPTQNLGQFLTLINNKKLFLNSRVILAEDVTNNAKISQLEAQNHAQTATVIAHMKPTNEKVEHTENNLQKESERQISEIQLADNLKYSTVDLIIKEPKPRIAEIPVINIKNIDNKYRFNFFYGAKNAIAEGFYLIKRFLVALITIWPFLLITGLLYYFNRKRKKKSASINTKIE